MKRLLSILFLLFAVPAIAADKPLVLVGAATKQLPAGHTLQVNASGTGAASINIPHGAAPTSPTNGDCWTTTGGLFCRINGAVGPYNTGTVGALTAARRDASAPGNRRAEIRAATAGRVVAPDKLIAASAPQTLTDSATTNWDMHLGFNAKWTLGGNRTLGTPTNPHEGLTYRLEVIQDATGSRTVTWPSAFDFGSAGTPTLSTGASKHDFIYLTATTRRRPSSARPLTRRASGGRRDA
jgi:hypothetical protein